MSEVASYTQVHMSDNNFDGIGQMLLDARFLYTFDFLP
jgi:hypothetical protein